MNNVDDFISSPNCHSGRRGRNIVALVFHDEEYPEQLGSARTVAAMFSRSSFQASTNAVCDAGEVIGVVDDEDTAWHTGAGFPYNECTWGVEHDGYAHQSRDEWLDAYGVAMLERSAALFAQRCHAFGIPARVIDAAQFRRAVASGNPRDGGIIGHRTITEAAGVYGGHTDPGDCFPWDYYEARVQAHYNGDASTPTAITAGVVVYRRNAEARQLAGDTTTMQRLLAGIAIAVNDASMNPGEADGDFGPHTEAALLAFQARALDADGHALDVDGVCGPKTWVALHVALYLAHAGQAEPVAAHSPAVPGYDGELRLGATASGAVRRWQQAMVDRGWTLTVDGDYGPQCQAVCRQFQYEKQLDVDGVVGPNTWAATWSAAIT